MWGGYHRVHTANYEYIKNPHRVHTYRNISRILIQKRISRISLEFILALISRIFIYYILYDGMVVDGTHGHIIDPL